MIRLLFSFYAICCTSVLYGQNPTRSLPYYIETARNNSPLIRDYHNQIAIQQNELQRLKAFYTRSRVELNGDYLFVPIIVREDGKTSFKWNAKDATDYYGYDLGEAVVYMPGLIGLSLYLEIKFIKQLKNRRKSIRIF